MRRLTSGDEGIGRRMKILMSFNHDYATDRQNIFLPKLLAEIVGYGYKMPQSYFAAWTGSYSHNKKMLDPDHTEIGIAAYTSITGVKYVTVLFLS